MKEEIRTLLCETPEEKMKLGLELLFLKYKKVSKENDDPDKVEHYSFFCPEPRCFEQEKSSIEKFFGFTMGVENPFNHEVLKNLENDYLIEISDSDNNRGDVKINVPNGINKLRELYGISENSDLEVAVINHTINNISIHIGDTITNITQGLSDNEKKEFLTILQEYSTQKDKKSFAQKLKSFSTKVGESVFTEVVVQCLKPDNLAMILNGMNF